MRSSVASALASTAAGRNASQSDERAEPRARLTAPASADSVTIGSKRAVAIGRAAVLRDVEEEVIRQPQRVEPERFGRRRVLDDVDHRSGDSPGME